MPECCNPRAITASGEDGSRSEGPRFFGRKKLRERALTVTKVPNFILITRKTKVHVN